MVDTLGTKSNDPQLLKIDLDYIWNQLTDKSKTVDEYKGITYRGKLKNMTVTFKEGRGLRIEGSLSKYYHGSNQYTLATNEVVKAVEYLCEDLCQDLMDYTVTRLDLADNIIPEHKAELYFNIFQYSNNSRLKRREEDNGLYLRNTAKVLCIYDKRVEVGKNRGESILPALADVNVLRCESRFLTHAALASFLKMQRVTVKDVLCNYQKLVDHWADSFLGISKKPDSVILDNRVFTSKGGFDKLLRVLGVQALGGINDAFKIIESAKKSGSFSKYPNESTNIKRKLKDLMSSPALFHTSDLGQELDDKVKWIRDLAYEPSFDNLNHDG